MDTYFGHVWGFVEKWTRLGVYTNDTLWRSFQLDMFGGIGHVWGEGHVSECYIYATGLLKY